MVVMHDFDCSFYTQNWRCELKNVILTPFVYDCGLHNTRWMSLDAESKY